jgi:hypothetical protein
MVVVGALREEGHDVLWVPQTSLRGERDEVIWRQAGRDQRILITKDLGFPLPGPGALGLVSLRGVHRISIASQVTMLLETINSLGEAMLGQQVVIAPGRVRLRDL